MSYKKCTIRQAIADIDQKKVYLPALQRKFVWGKQQIELFFDSLIRDYPIGTFLFWKIHSQNAESYVFYEFLTEYDERNPYNRRKTGSFLYPEIIGVLDGQQRLSSIYIGLMGTHTEKTPYKHTKSKDAFKKTRLYLNLLSLPYVVNSDDRVVTAESQDFEFRFLPEETALVSERRMQSSDASDHVIEPTFWMPVGSVLSWGHEPEFDRLVEKFIATSRSNAQRDALTNASRYVRRALETLHRRIHVQELINYFEVVKDELEDILPIFVRVNSGGTVLNKTDLLFSTIVATWDDGREEIESLQKTINDKGNGFSFGNEFLMRCCLVLTDGPVSYKVNSFKAESVEKIQREWPLIAVAVARTVDLLVEFGFEGRLLTSQNATIIIAYYIYKGGLLNEESKNGMRKYLLHALLNGIYGSSQEQLITVLRASLRTERPDALGQKVFALNQSKFSFPELLRVELPSNRTLAITEADLDRFLDSEKGPMTFFLLALLYPALRHSEVSFHQDHLHPQYGFNKENMKSVGIPESEWPEWWNLQNRLPNLQLLSESRNTSKNATPLKQWVDDMTDSVQKTFAVDNFLPDGCSLAFVDFKDFYAKRRALLREKLAGVLTMTKHQVPQPNEEWEAHRKTSE